MKVNIHTGEIVNKLSPRLSEQDALEHGWRDVGERWTGEVPEGQRIKERTWLAQGDGTANEEVVLENIPALKVSQDTVDKANAYKNVMERNFGVGAHRNKGIDKDAVVNWGYQKNENGNLNIKELADLMIMKDLRDTLKERLGTGDMWEVFDKLDKAVVQ